MRCCGRPSGSCCCQHAYITYTHVHRSVFVNSLALLCRLSLEHTAIPLLEPGHNVSMHSVLSEQITELLWPVLVNPHGGCCGVFRRWFHFCIVCSFHSDISSIPLRAYSRAFSRDFISSTSRNK